MASQATHLAQIPSGDYDSQMCMPMVFDFTTKVTFLFSSWTTTTTASYVLLLAFVFLLPVLKGFLGLLKNHLVLAHPEAAFCELFAFLVDLRTTQQHRHAARYQLTPPSQDNELEELDAVEEAVSLPTAHILGPPVNSLLYESRPTWPQKFANLMAWLRSWCRWTRSWTNNSIFALLEIIRTIVVYVLMIAVMSLNFGVLCAVLGGVLVEELLLGRYTRSSPNKSKDQCHE
ncbi:hypothetical protein N7468_002393 [Penicillium chermesinum]|uniref:Copper transport protein n=1 Tax=Penicillium chermesinum TaxID=63820 RepID=A0A9W9PIK0_9EURO|nr:uncharacterized protein N7468_002393 [Penicillium chermesinum]KAJ5247410.1 hypothetical protein N7468_002393 [Penicillium chermesinum]KAJ6145650.1 hypothetical protein N7470_009545 [Penicillium chermesinum]